MVPIFEKYLRLFQSEGPLVHIMFQEMKDVLTTIMKRFMKASVVDGKLTRELMELDIENNDNHLDYAHVDFGQEARSQVTANLLHLG